MDEIERKAGNADVQANALMRDFDKVTIKLADGSDFVVTNVAKQRRLALEQTVAADLVEDKAATVALAGLTDVVKTMAAQLSAAGGSADLAPVAAQLDAILTAVRDSRQAAVDAITALRAAEARAAQDEAADLAVPQG